MGIQPLDAEQIFNTAREKADSKERAGYLDGACGNDVGLRAKVEALLRADAEAGSFLASVEVDPDATMPQTGRGGRPHATGRSRSAPAEQPGQMIGRYKLLQPIGEGGFGSVWMAEQREPLKRKVALKVIKLGMDTKQVIARFEAERQALAMMEHPNIAKVLDAGATESGRPYFVMELVKGVPITEYCDTENLTTQERIRLFTKVCHAVQHAHQKGIIHRDIKPANVMITLHDGKPVPKVIDFGIAKATNRELTDKTLFTEYRQMIGTPAYMSPEQAEMSGLDIDTRSDIYSLGVLLYELLTGLTPFDPKKLRSAAINEIQRIIREEEPPRPSTRLSEVGHTQAPSSVGEDEDSSEAQRSSIQYIAKHRRTDPRSLTRQLRGDLDWIIMKALEKDRSRRYETANGLAEDIERHLNDEPVVATPPSAPYKLKKLIKRNKGAFCAAAVVFLVLTLGVIGTTTGMLRAMDAETRAERELVRANEVKRLIKEMLGSVTPEKALGTDITLLKNILDDTAARLTKGEVKDELIAAELHSVVGDVYSRLGLYEDAERHLLVAIEVRTRILGEEHPVTAGSLSILGLLYAHQRRNAEAERLLLKTLEIRKGVLGEEDGSTLASMSNLAVAYVNQRRYSKAEPLFQKALEINKRVLGEEHPNTLRMMTNLAIAYMYQGRHAEAEPLFLKTLEMKKRVLSEEHIDTLKCMGNLAYLYQKQGRYAEAEPLYLKTLEIRKRILGEKHSQTLGLITNLGNLYNKMERFADARAMYEVSLPLKRRILSVRHPWTRNAMIGLAKAYVGLGRREDALPLYRELLDLQLAAADDPDAAPNTLNDAAWTLLTQDFEELRDPERALRWAERACSKEEEAGGGNLWMFLDTLALAQHRTGDTATAIETQKRALSLIPDGADKATREEIENNLRTFEAAPAETDDPPADRGDQ